MPLPLLPIAIGAAARAAAPAVLRVAGNALRSRVGMAGRLMAPAGLADGTIASAASTPAPAPDPMPTPGQRAAARMQRESTLAAKPPIDYGPSPKIWGKPRQQLSKS